MSSTENQDGDTNTKNAEENKQVEVLFRYDRKDDKTYCLIGNCKSDFKGKSDLSKKKRHLGRLHKDIQATLKLKKDEKTQQEILAKRHARRRFVTVTIYESDMIKGLIELVTVNNRPYSFLNDSGFRNAFKPITDAFKTQSPPMRLPNRNNATDYIKIAAQKVNDLVKAELKGKTLSIMVDIATKHGRSVLGINAQYCLQDTIVTRHLGIIRLHTRNTGANIKNTLQDIFNNYEIDLKQIISITMDNGANILKAADLLSAEACKDQANEHPAAVIDNEDDDQDDNQDDDQNADSFLLNMDVSEFFLPADMNINDVVANVLSSLITEDPGIQTLYHIRCSAHTLQLCIRDAIEVDKPTKKLIEKCKNVVRLIRNQNIRKYLESINRAIPPVDCITRWEALFLMLKGLYDLKDEYPNIFCMDVKKFQECLMDDQDWQNLEKIMNIFKETYKLTKAMQAEDFTITDLFAGWLGLRMKLEKIAQCESETVPDSDVEASQVVNVQLKYASKLIAAMNYRETSNQILAHPLILCAVFLDPRYNCLLSDDQKNIAISHLTNIWLRILSLAHPENNKEAEEDTNSVDSNSRAASPTFTEDSNEIYSDVLEEYFQTMDLLRSVDPEMTEKQAERDIIKEKLIAFSQIPRMPRSKHFKIREHWITNQLKQPELYKLALVVLSIPVTQTSVERAFSGLGIVLTDRRTRMSDDNLSNTMVIKLNPSLFNELVLFDEY